MCAKLTCICGNEHAVKCWKTNELIYAFYRIKQFFCKQINFIPFAIYHLLRSNRFADLLHRFQTFFAEIPCERASIQEEMKRGTTKTTATYISKSIEISNYKMIAFGQSANETDKSYALLNFQLNYKWSRDWLAGESVSGPSSIPLC